MYFTKKIFPLQNGLFYLLGVNTSEGDWKPVILIIGKDSCHGVRPKTLHLLPQTHCSDSVVTFSFNVN
jgi:hypothetical protein